MVASPSCKNGNQFGKAILLLDGKISFLAHGFGRNDTSCKCKSHQSLNLFELIKSSTFLGMGSDQFMNLQSTVFQQLKVHQKSGIVYGPLHVLLYLSPGHPMKYERL